MTAKRVAYADPPYPGMSGFYKDHPDYAGEIDHADLIGQMHSDYDGWVLHTASTTLAEVLPLCPVGTRVGAWVKSFASFQKNNPVAYAWEPILFWPCRKRSSRLTITDWVLCPMTLQRGLVGVKPDMVIKWAFTVVGLEPTDELVDLFPGSGAVATCWERWRAETRLAV